MKEDIKEQIKTLKAELFDLQLAMGKINELMQQKIKKVNDLTRELNICLPSEKQ